MADYLTRAEMQEMRSQHDGMFTPGSLFATAVVPGFAELRADRMLSPKSGKLFGFLPKTGEAIRPDGIKPEVIKNASKVKHRIIGGVTSAEHKKVVQAVRLRQFARGVGMAEIIKLGADLGGMAVDAVMSYRSAPKDIKLSTGPGFFSDTRAAQTQRQRAIQAIHNSQLTTRAALGNEAAFLHI